MSGWLRLFHRFDHMHGVANTVAKARLDIGRRPSCGIVCDWGGGRKLGLRGTRHGVIPRLLLSGFADPIEA